MWQATELEDSSVEAGHRAGGVPASWPVMICLLGGFRVLKAGAAVTAPPDSKPGVFLRRMALAGPGGVPRTELLDTLWGDADDVRVINSFNSLVTEVRRGLRDVLGEAPPILNGDGCYRLNRKAGVAVDVDCFDDQVDRGHRAHAQGQADAALDAYEAALALYVGDLYIGRGDRDEIHAFVEQERLRSRCLTALGRAAELTVRAGNFERAMACAWRLLTLDPCSEVGHRLVMHAYAARGQRGQALRQFRVCAEAVRREYDSAPEPTTVELYDLIRRGDWDATSGARLIGG